LSKGIASPKVPDIVAGLSSGQEVARSYGLAASNNKSNRAEMRVEYGSI